jgi:hypothetical protein
MLILKINFKKYYLNIFLNKNCSEKLLQLQKS